MLSASLAAGIIVLLTGTACERAPAARTPANWRRAGSVSHAIRQAPLPTTTDLQTAEATRLVDDTFPFIAQVHEVSQDRDGDYFVTDLSDKDVKVYDHVGRRLRTIGGPGVDDSTFAQLGDAELAGDTLVAFDAARQRVLMFNLAGRFARLLPVPPPAVAAVRVLDDSLLLYVARVAAGPGLLRVVRLDGSLVSTFYARAAMTDIDPLVLFHTHLMADGANGMVVVGVAGTDSLFAFDYAGHRLAAGLVDGPEPLPSLAEALAANHGRARLRDGNWYYDGVRFLFRVLVLDRAHVLVHIAPYNTRDGTDLARGGTIVELARVGDEMRVARQWESRAGLFGRTANGSALYVAYADTTGVSYAVMRAPLPVSTSKP